MGGQCRTRAFWKSPAVEGALVPQSHCIVFLEPWPAWRLTGLGGVHRASCVMEQTSKAALAGCFSGAEVTNPPAPSIWGAETHMQRTMAQGWVLRWAPRGSQLSSVWGRWGGEEKSEELQVVMVGGAQDALRLCQEARSPASSELQPHHTDLAPGFSGPCGDPPPPT